MCAYQGVKMLGFWFLPNNHKLTEVYLNSVKHSRCKCFFCDSVIESFNWFYMILKIVHKKTDDWYIEWQWVVQRVTTSDNEWGRVVRVTTNDNEWYNGWQRVTTNENEWQRVTNLSAKFSFFQIREELTTNHPKENSLNIA